MSVVRNTTTVGGYTMISRITGFLRDILIATTLGAGPVADAFLVAFKFPNFFRRLTAEGAFSVAFVPLFVGILQGDGKSAALRLAEEAFAMMAVVLFAVTLGIVIFMPAFMHVLAPGFARTPERYDLAVELARIAFFYMPVVSLSALLGGVLNSIGRFAAMAAAPILLNLVLIAAMTIFAGSLKTPGYALAWGVAVAGVVQFLWLAAVCRRNDVTVRWRLPRWTPGVARLCRLMVPAALGAAVVQVNLLIDVILASTLPTGAISVLYYADRVNQLPLGVVGIAIGTALLPGLARQIRAGEDQGAEDSQNQALEFGMLLGLPAAAGLMVLALPIVTILFGYGVFDAVAASATADALLAYAAGLPAFVLIKVLQPGFYARQDIATPVKVAAAAVALNLILNLILMQYYAHVGLAMATSIAAWVNTAALLWFLRRRGFYLIGAPVRGRLWRMMLAAGVMAGGLFLAASQLAAWLQGSVLQAASALAVLVIGGMALFATIVVLFGVVRIDQIRAILRRLAPTS